MPHEPQHDGEDSAWVSPVLTPSGQRRDAFMTLAIFSADSDALTWAEGEPLPMYLCGARSSLEDRTLKGGQGRALAVARVEERSHQVTVVPPIRIAHRRAAIQD